LTAARRRIVLAAAGGDFFERNLFVLETTLAFHGQITTAVEAA
jgi:hypothetical protein